MSSRLRQRLLLAGSATIAILMWSASAQAQNVLYFNDLSVGQDRMAEALAGLGGSYSVFSTDDTTTFITELNSGSYDLAIFFQQNNFGYDDAYTALSTYIGAGGRAIGDDFSRDQTHAAVYGASFTGNINETEVTVTDPILSNGIVNPVTLFNPGWGTFSTGLSGGVSAATFGNGDSAIVIGNGGRTIFNGFLNDTFANGQQGVQLYTNEIGYLVGQTPPPPAVPEPGEVATGTLLGCCVVGLMLRRRFTRHNDIMTNGCAA